MRLGGGTLLLVLGVIGGFIPVLQGWLLVLAGLSLMAPESRRARRALRWAKRRVRSRSRGDIGCHRGPGLPGDASEDVDNG